METSNQSKIKNLVAPDAERRRATQEKLKEISCYLLIGIISIITIFVVPLLSGSIQGDFKMCFPKTAEGWIVYWAISGGSALGNISIFVLFKLQAKINCQDNENFKKTFANKLDSVLGKDISGETVRCNVSKMPHLLQRLDML